MLRPFLLTQFGSNPIFTGVGILNEQNVLYIENRNGNSDAKAFQLDTLERMFQHLKDNNISRIDKFRVP
ncbi:MAG: hypothetical protein IPG79_21300 [Saprospiraceae bacterium]|nr:hypothetical protein [Saprospiraceae bacterium]